MAKRIFEKLEKLNSKDEFVFKLEFNGNVIYKTEVEVPEYASSIIDDDELKLYYFFKDMSLKLEEKIIEVHKNKMWKDANGENNDNTI